MLAKPIHTTCKTSGDRTPETRKSDDAHCIHKQEKAKDENTQDRTTAQRHKCRDNQDHASKPKHHRRSAADASKYKIRTRRRKAKRMEISKTIIAACGTCKAQMASNTHFIADASKQDHSTCCAFANRHVTLKSVARGGATGTGSVGTF